MQWTRRWTGSSQNICREWLHSLGIRGVLRTSDIGFNYDGSWGSCGFDRGSIRTPGEWRPKSYAESTSDGMITKVEEMPDTDVAPDMAH
jgi:hypothetical protein